MLFLFKLEHIVGFIERTDPFFIQSKNSAMIYLLWKLQERLITDYLIPCELEIVVPLDMPIVWDSRHDFILSRDINVLLTLLREASFANRAIHLRVVDDWVFGVEIT